jgi:plastocyanin
MNRSLSNPTPDHPSRRSILSVRRLTALAVMFGAGISVTTASAHAAAKMPEIEITANGSSFRASAPTYKTGWTKVTLVNEDKDSHQAALIRLPKNVTAADFSKKFATEGARALAMTTSSGGPAVAFPGLSSSVTVNLSEGTYLAMDLIPGADGALKATKGFMTSFVVKTPMGGSASTHPRASATVELHDFLFKGKVTLKQGTTIAVRNDGNQPHELVMFGLAPGKTVDDVIGFLSNPAPSGPPPFVAAAGLAGIAPKATGYLGIDVPPGKYVFLCFLPDVAGKGEPHFTKGMMANAEVTA